MDNKLLTLAALSQLPSFTLNKDSISALEVCSAAVRFRSICPGCRPGLSSGYTLRVFKKALVLLLLSWLILHIFDIVYQEFWVSKVIPLQEIRQLHLVQLSRASVFSLPPPWRPHFFHAKKGDDVTIVTLLCLRSRSSQDALDVPHSGIAEFSVRRVPDDNTIFLDMTSLLAGQTTQWKAHHRKLCKEYNGYTASAVFQSLSETERVDAVLLSQLIATMFPKNTFNFDSISLEDPCDDLASTFLDLMQKGHEELSVPPVCVPRGSPGPPPSQFVLDLFSRFGNNNFVIHSHLTGFSHGIFPVASRLLNHSCIPNCVPKYILTPGQPIRMEVIALRSIKIGEEVRWLNHEHSIWQVVVLTLGPCQITIPYLDVALPYDTRSIALQGNYGFRCQCSLCKSCDRIYPVPTLPKEETDLHRLETLLTSLVIEQASDGSVLLKGGDFDISMLPPELYPLFDQSYLPRISEAFSKASHEGQYDVALMAGLVMLAMYVVIYPSNFPLVGEINCDKSLCQCFTSMFCLGMHALELAKTSWNAAVSNDSLALNHHIRAPTPKHLEKLAQSYLEIAQRILEIYGPEGDQGGPMEEIVLLRELLVM